MTSAPDQIPEPEFEDDILDELSPGTTLLHGQYTIESFLNSGGFGITYLAHDSLERKVVIKECFPSSFCRRSKAIVHARSRAHQGEFNSVVKLFVQEARSLAKLDHPNIVGVHQVFEDNSTAYMALDLVEGRDLLDTLEDENHGLKPDQIKSILVQLLGAVGYIHSLNVLHRDISPDNILLTPSMKPILIDFGAAREEAAKSNRVLSALLVVKDGYSPQEFYISGSEQSPSSDLYALGASFYHLIAGKIPPNSQLRLSAMAAQEPDPYVPLVGNTKGYDDAFLMALDKSLKVMPKDRLGSAQEWLDIIQGNNDAATPAPAIAEGPGIETIVSDLIEKNEPHKKDKAPKVDVAPKVDKAPKVDTKKDVFPQLSNDVDAVVAATVAAEGGSPKKGKGPLMLLLASAAVVAIVGVGMQQAGIFSVSDDPQTPIGGVETASMTQTAGVESTTPGAVPQITVPPAVQADVEQVATLDTPNEVSPPTTPVGITETDSTPKTTPPLFEELGTKVTAEPSLPDTVLAARDNPPPAAPAGEATEPVQLLSSTEVLASHWVTRLPFHPSVDAPNEIGTVQKDADAWMQPGRIIVAVNGRQVAAISDIEKLLQETVDLGDATVIQVEFEVANSDTGAVSSYQTTLPVIHETSVLNGTRFQTTFVNDVWQTRVVANLDSTSSDLRIGDILIANLETSERFLSRDAVAVIINSGIAKGQDEFQFIVDRDGSNAFASLDLSGIRKVNTAPPAGE